MSDQPPDALGLRALVTGLRDGRAGFVPRLGLSVAAGVFSLSALMLALGVVDASSRRVRDEEVFLGLFIAAAAWCGLLIPIWRTYTKWRHTLTTILTCVVVLVCTAAVGGFVGAAVRNPEFLIASSTLLGVGITIGIIAGAIHRGSRGRSVLGARGQVDVRCPRCSYSMAGLDSTACPECGHRCTIDALILAQGYEGTRVIEPAVTAPALPASV